MALPDWMKTDCMEKATKAGYQDAASYLWGECSKFCRSQRDSEGKAIHTGGYCIKGSEDALFGCECDCKCTGSVIVTYEDKEFIL